MFHQLLALSLILSLSALSLAESAPFTLTAKSTNTTLNNTHAYIYVDPLNPFEGVFFLTADATIPATNFTYDNLGGHLFAHTDYVLPGPLLEGGTNNDAYDETVLWTPPEIVAESGQNPPLCHVFKGALSCEVTSEGDTRLTKLYICPHGIGYGTTGGALKIGKVVVDGCSEVTLVLKYL